MASAHFSEELIFIKTVFPAGILEEGILPPWMVMWNFNAENSGVRLQLRS